MALDRKGLTMTNNRPITSILIIVLLGLAGMFLWGDSSPVSTATPETTAEAESFVSQAIFTPLVTFPNSPLRRPLSGVTYGIRDTRIGSMRQGEEQWQVPIYRPSECASQPLVTIDNRYSSRFEYWPIPTYARPATAADAHLGVVCPDMNEYYEMWEASWQSNTLIVAGGMVDYNLDGNGITARSNHRTTAAGIAMGNGIVSREDFTDPTTGMIDITITRINHALNISLPARLLSTTFIAPAVGGEESGSAGANGIPMGAIFAFPPDVDIDAIPNLHPFTRLILHAAQDYGMYVTDGNGSAANPDGSGNANVRVETGLLQTLYGVTNDSLMSRIQSETRSVISQYGIYRITFTGASTPVPTTVSSTRTAAPNITATVTRTPTNTQTPVAVTPTRTPTATRTATPSANASSTPTPRTLTCRLFWDFRLICP